MLAKSEWKGKKYISGINVFFVQLSLCQLPVIGESFNRYIPPVNGFVIRVNYTKGC